MRRLAVVLLLTSTIAAAQTAPDPAAEFKAVQKLYVSGNYPQAFNRMLRLRQAIGRSFLTDYWLARIACSFQEKRADGQRLLVAMETDYKASAASAPTLIRLVSACGVTPSGAWGHAAAAASVNSTSASPHPVIPAFAGAAGATTHSRPRPQRTFTPARSPGGVASMSNPD